MDSAKKRKTGKKNYNVKIDFFEVFVISADSTDTWRSAIDFFLYKKIKKIKNLKPQVGFQLCTCSQFVFGVLPPNFPNL